MKVFEVIGKILGFIKDILTGVVILAAIFIIGLIFGFIVLADGVFGLFETKKVQNQNDPDLDE